MWLMQCLSFLENFRALEKYEMLLFCAGHDVPYTKFSRFGTGNGAATVAEVMVEQYSSANMK